MPNYKVGSSYIVHITHVNHPHSFYIRRTEFDDIMEQLETPGPPLEVLYANFPVVYHSDTVKKYVRGRIHYSYDPASGGNKCDIYAVDYGFMDQSVPLDKIYKQPEVLTPSLADHCELYMCSPKGPTFSEGAIKAMKLYIGTEVAKMTVKAIDGVEEKLTVQIVNSCPDDIATLLALTDHTTLCWELPSVSAIKTPPTSEIYFKPRQINVNDTFHVTVQNGTDLSGFYVAEVNDFKEYLKDRNDFHDYCRNMSPVRIVVVGQSVGAFYNFTLKYERALVKAITIPGSKALVKLVDWGKEIEVGFPFIRAIKKAVFTLKPSLAIYCSADENQIWDNKLHRFLYPGYEFRIKIIAVGKNGEPNKVDLIRLDNY